MSNLGLAAGWIKTCYYTVFVITYDNCAECKSPIITCPRDDLKDDCIFKILLPRKSAVNLFQKTKLKTFTQ